MKQLLINQREEGNNAQKFPLFPFPKSAGFGGKKGNNAFRLIPPFPAGSRGMQK